jgi:ribosomal protein S18 acetylase RimI-like enzyme
MITYLESADDLSIEQLQGFFVGWPNRPSPAALLRVLQASDYVGLARDENSGHILGYITAISDGVSCAYIPHLEVRPDWQGQGIGSELVRRLLARLNHLYMIDLMCDPDVQPFYKRLGMRPSTGMVIRNYDQQNLE